MPIEVANLKLKSIFSDDSQHRYQMSKIWDKNLPQANIITIAPSECHNVVNDLTTNIITNNLHMLDFGGYTMTNLISKIGVDIKKIKNTKDLWNNETDKHILSCAEAADKIIVAWGSFAHTRKQFADREKQVLELLKPFQDKVYQITDGADRNFLKPLTPVVRNGFVLKSVKF